MTDKGYSIHWIHFLEKHDTFCNLLHNMAFKVKYLLQKEKGQPNFWENYTEFIGVSEDISGCRISLLLPFSKTYLFEVVLSFTVILEALYGVRVNKKGVRI